MAEDNSGNPLGCLGPAVGIAGLVATLALGPIDIGRSIYNQIVGDTPILKRELLDYSRRQIQRENPSYTPGQVETKLANEVGYKFRQGGGEKINHLDVSIEKLWDASEDHARTWFERWVWPSLD